MQEKVPDRNKSEFLNKVIRVAYGDAGITEKIIVMWKAAKDGNVKHLLEEYRTTANKVRKLKGAELPDYVIENMNEKISSQRASDNFFSRFYYAFFTVFLKKAIPITVVRTALIVLISFLLFKEPAPSHKYTKAEIELAEIQLRQSLAIVGKVFTKVEESFSEDILNNQINKTLNKGYYLVNNILIGG
jgi:hypothetical protein